MSAKIPSRKTTSGAAPQAQQAQPWPEAVHSDESARRLRASPIEVAVTAEVEAQLRSGALRPGDRINESALAAKLGSSRGPVREALRTLEHSGLVRSEMNRGVIVQELSATEALEIYDLRAALFRLACESACTRATSTWLRSLAGLVELMDKAVEADDIDAYYPTNVEFHNRIVERAGNKRLEEFWSQLERRLHLFRRRGLVPPGAMRLSNSEHRRMIEAFTTGDMATLGILAQQHMLESKTRMLTSLATSVKSL